MTFFSHPVSKYKKSRKIGVFKIVKKYFKKISKKTLQIVFFVLYYLSANASVAHLVERHLAKVEVASASLVTRSSYSDAVYASFFRFILLTAKNSAASCMGKKAYAAFIPICKAA